MLDNSTLFGVTPSKSGGLTPNFTIFIQEQRPNINYTNYLKKFTFECKNTTKCLFPFLENLLQLKKGGHHTKSVSLEATYLS
jgi:hypothetical protein